MKGKLLVVFNSAHAYVKRYVDIIGNELGCDAVPGSKVRADMLAAYDKIVFISAVRNGDLFGLKKFSEYMSGIYNKRVICAVGPTPFNPELPKRIKNSAISVTYEKFLPVFYAQGGFDINELTRPEKLLCVIRRKQISMAEVLDESDTCFLKAFDTPLDEVKRENIMPLVDYLDGKKVDENLYSPPEITDPEEIKKFFDEQAAAQNPDTKNRELKKKLK